MTKEEEYCIKCQECCKWLGTMQPGITQEVVERGSLYGQAEWYKSYYGYEYGQPVDYRAVTIQKR